MVVGSALVDAVKDSLDKNGKATARTVKAVTTLVAELANGVRGAQAKSAVIAGVMPALVPSVPTLLMHGCDANGVGS